MSRRIAHRPRYRSIQKPIPSSFRADSSFILARWKYRNRSTNYEKQLLGSHLALLPLRHRLMQHLVLYPAW